MLYADLFGWWIATIAWSIAFPIAVSIYLYRRRPGSQPPSHGRKLLPLGAFTFVWFLLGLLAFYIITVSRGSALLFALGNIAVEALLLFYVLASGGEGAPAEKR